MKVPFRETQTNTASGTFWGTHDLALKWHSAPARVRRTQRSRSRLTLARRGASHLSVDETAEGQAQANRWNRWTLALGEKKRAKTAETRTAGAVDRLKAQLDKQQTALAASISEVVEREQAVKAKDAAITKKEENIARATAKGEADEDRKTGKLSQHSLDFIDTSEQELKPKTGEVLCKVQSGMILMLLFALRKEGRSENQTVLQVSTSIKFGCFAPVGAVFTAGTIYISTLQHSALLIATLCSCRNQFERTMPHSTSKHNCTSSRQLNSLT